MLFQNYQKEEMKSLMEAHKNLILDILEKILENYDEFQDVKSMILITGSFARDTNLLYSDLDISFHYDNKYKEKFLEIEEQISYLLSEVLGFRGRDRIHGITYYLPKLDEKPISCILKNDYVLHFLDEDLHFKCRENSFDTMNNIYSATRSVADLKEYISSNFLSCVDWTNNFIYFKDNGCKDDFCKELEIKEMSLLSKWDKRKSINELEASLKHMIFFPKACDEYVIKDLKNIYKNEVLANFYKLLAIIRRIAVMNGYPVQYINLKDFDNLNLLNCLHIDSTLLTCSYYYLFLITKLQYLLDSLGYDLSKHSNKKVKITLLNQKCKEMSFECDFIMFINEEKKVFQTIMLNTLEKIKEEYL